MLARLKKFALGLFHMVLLAAAIAILQRPMKRHLADTVGLPLFVAVILGLYVAGRRCIEHEMPTELQPRRAPLELGAGAVLGMVLFSCVMGLLWLFGTYHASGLGSAALALPLLQALAAAVIEELVFRGFVFRLFAKVANIWVGTAVCSLAFGFAHISNPGATTMSSLAITIEAGVLLCAAYAYTGRLWLPIGLHLGWNFTEGTIFSMTVSGIQQQVGLIRGTLSGGALLTGSRFGPEASLLAVLVCLVPAVLMLRAAMRTTLATSGAEKDGGGNRF